MIGLLYDICHAVKPSYELTDTDDTHSPHRALHYFQRPGVKSGRISSLLLPSRTATFFGRLAEFDLE